MVGKFDENTNSDSDNTDTYYSGDDDLESYDGFSGGYQLSKVTIIIEV